MEYAMKYAFLFSVLLIF